MVVLKMNNKKAWIRIVEAFLAILILSTFLFIIIGNQNKNGSFGERVYQLERVILRDISKNETLREAVLKDNEEGKTMIEDHIRSNIPSMYNFSIRICPVADICGMEFYVGEKDVYANSILISSTLEKYEPKQLKLFVWLKD